jgi:hypothetical protein
MEIWKSEHKIQQHCKSWRCPHHIIGKHIRVENPGEQERGAAFLCRRERDLPEWTFSRVGQCISIIHAPAVEDATHNGSCAEGFDMVRTARHVRRIEYKCEVVQMGRLDTRNKPADRILQTPGRAERNRGTSIENLQSRGSSLALSQLREQDMEISVE